LVDEAQIATKEAQQQQRENIEKDTALDLISGNQFVSKNTNQKGVSNSPEIEGGGAYVEQEKKKGGEAISNEPVGV